MQGGSYGLPFLLYVIVSCVAYWLQYSTCFYILIPYFLPPFYALFLDSTVISGLSADYHQQSVSQVYHSVPLPQLNFQNMTNELTFNDLPQVVAELRDEVIGMRQMLTSLQKEKGQRKENTHRPMSVEEAAEYLKIPLRTLYMKLGNGTIPATKPGKRYVLYQDELDRWLECNRKNPVPLTDEEQNAAILAANRRKPNKADWR